MKRLLSFLKKFDTPLTYGIILLVFGISFIFIPEKVLDWLVAIAGAATVAVSLIKLAVLLEDKGSHPFFIAEAVKVSITAFAGVMLMVLRSGFAEAVCAALGVYILISSAIHLFASSYTPPSLRGRVWVADIVLSVVLIVFGLWLIIYPLWPCILVGITLLLFGLELIGQESTRRRKRDKEKEKLSGGVYYTDDFEDKSDEV